MWLFPHLPFRPRREVAEGPPGSPSLGLSPKYQVAKDRGYPTALATIKPCQQLDSESISWPFDRLADGFVCLWQLPP